ncbi:G protein-regulated inducer of neurite outgrowth 2 [Sphaerodactylus townsendi]|uniref:G protein-regulated inducer of neurite outgrowth 2 n=1 Tax=Sphaerodactylus townsendi TaxID=933632 RepID=UPI002026F741|nr:G protein-regulated inducer of neurite outgrowth 2 [Sphaerodactylus townsendi]XP_048360806.1 G protein-regulated inducer of neurite outgrowth 2 [Sphaerodactylus townsendi]
MANHQLHTSSHRETLNSICHGTPSPNYHLLSKSSSNLVVDSGEKRSSKQELRKSFSSSACQVQTNETDAESAPSSEWSLTHSEIASTIRTLSSFSPSDSAQSGPKSTNHFLSADNSSEPMERMDAGENVQSVADTDMSPACDTNPPDVNMMEVSVQRSLSDLTCRCKQQSPAPHMETSATYSAMSSNSGYGVPAGNLAFQKLRYGSHAYDSAPGLPSNPNVPANIFDNVSHNQIFSDPGTYSTAVLGSHMPRDNPSNSAMYAQGGIVYSNFSAGMYPPGLVAIQNSTALPYNIRQEPAMNVEGTSPAYCHSLPIPPLQFIPRLVCSVSESGKEQVSPGYCPSLPVTGVAPLPKLVSSVSESGLDAKRILGCPRVHGDQSYSQQIGPQQERKTTYVVLNSCQDGTEVVLKTKDMWTMTSMNDMIRGLQPPLECKDAGVQTNSTKECKSVATSPSVVVEDPPHMYPECNLEPEAEGEKSPVREVRWDDEGMTWEVYGAEVDPEELGVAIQKHLEVQIEQLQSETVTLSRKSTDEGEKRLSFRTMMYCLRNPSCCARSSAALE